MMAFQFKQCNLSMSDAQTYMDIKICIRRQNYQKLQVLNNPTIHINSLKNNTATANNNKL